MADEKYEAEEKAHDDRVEAARHERESANAAEDEADQAKRRAAEAEREAGV